MEAPFLKNPPVFKTFRPTLSTAAPPRPQIWACVELEGIP